MRKRKTVLIVVVVLAVVISVGLYVRQLLHGVENAYAVWNVADWTIDYMESHDGQWPRSWSDLEAMYRARAQRDVGGDMEHYRKLVEIDFTADPVKLAKTSFEPGQKEPPFRVIRHRRRPHWVYNEPNEMVWHYFQNKFRSATRPTTMPRVIGLCTGLPASVQHYPRK